MTAADHSTFPRVPGALDLVRASRHRPRLDHPADWPCATLFKPLKKPGFGAALGVLLGLFACGPAAEAANPFEMNFWLSGPKYDGRVAPCEAALPTITSQFQDKESTYWNSSLTITGYGGSTKPRSGPGSPTTFRAATAAAT